MMAYLTGAGPYTRRQFKRQSFVRPALSRALVAYGKSSHLRELNFCHRLI